MRKILYLVLLLITPSNLIGESWSEFSLVLKPSSFGGIGVFATHDFPAGAVILTHEHQIRIMKKKDIPSDFVKFCIHINDEECFAPERFDRLEIGWYMNHSTKPNIAPRTQVHNADLANGIKIHGFIAIKDIKAGEEILLNYNDLDEPEHLKEDYYQKDAMENKIQVQRIAAKAIIVNENNEVLMLREAGTYTEGTNIGKYLLPGGRIEVGERFLDGLRREVAEETGLDVEVGDPVLVGEWFPVIKGVSNQIVAIFFACKPVTKNITLSAEHDHFVWLNPKNVASYTITDSDRKAIEKVVTRKQY